MLAAALSTAIMFSPAASGQVSEALASFGLAAFDEVSCTTRLTWPLGTECAGESHGVAFTAADERAVALSAALDAAGALAARSDGSGIHVITWTARSLSCPEAALCEADVDDSTLVTVAGDDAKRLFELMGLAGVGGSKWRHVKHVSSAFGAALPDEAGGGRFDVLYLLDSGQLLASQDRDLSEETRELLVRQGADKIYVEDDSDVFAHDLSCFDEGKSWSCTFHAASAD
jgi:hypothetical protein